MNSLFYSSATAQTGRTSPLHCPSCRCQQVSPFRQTNLYLSPNCPSNDNLTMTFNPMQSLFARTAPALTHQASPNKRNITFCYTSPIYLKKHHSSESRFNTKRFKQTHFPLLKENLMKEEPVLKILKNKNKSNLRPKCLECSNQEGRPNILKMNRMKGLRKSNKNISSNSSHSLNVVSKTNSLNQQLSSDLNQEEILPQQETPIDIFKSETPKQYQLQANSKQSKEELIKKSKPEEYPTVKSIDVFKVQEKGKEMRSQTSFRVEQKNVSKQWNQIDTDREIASSIHEQLDLNFDYYVLHYETDRSISENIDL